MARDCYETTIALPDATAAYVLKPLSAVKVSVVPRGATDIINTLIDIFPADIGLTKGPDPKSGATGTNPFTTGVSGAVRFWAEGPAEYDIVFEDTVVPARVTDRVGWNAVPSKAGSLSTSVLSADAGIKQTMLAPEVVNNEVPIGGVIEWWRPAQSVPTPVGYEICDGRTVTQHDFPGVAGSVALPDLRNVFILGADSTKGDGAGASGTDGNTNGPGIRGVGGSNQHLLTATELASHAHTATSGSMNRNNAHGHQIGGTSVNVAPVSDTGFWVLGHDSGAMYAMPNPQQAILVTDTNHEHGITVNATAAGVAHNNMPKWIGLLRIMKVKRV
jgi:hypothetical protein